MFLLAFAAGVNCLTFADSSFSVYVHAFCFALLSVFFGLFIFCLLAFVSVSGAPLTQSIPFLLTQYTRSLSLYRSPCVAVRSPAGSRGFLDPLCPS